MSTTPRARPGTSRPSREPTAQEWPATAAPSPAATPTPRRARRSPSFRVRALSQTFAFAAGTYTVSFDAAQRVWYQSSSQTFEVLLDGTVIGTFTPGSSSYTLYTTNSFTVAAGNHTLAFVGLNSSGGDHTAFIDAVTVTDPSTGLNDANFASPSVGTGSSAYQYRPHGHGLELRGPVGSQRLRSGRQRQRLHRRQPQRPAGPQAAFLQGTGALSQTFAFAAGTYTVSFDAAQRGLVSERCAQTFEVLLDGTVIGTFTPGSSSYTLYTTNSFTVAAGNHTLAFVGLNPSGGDHPPY